MYKKCFFQLYQFVGNCLLQISSPHLLFSLQIVTASYTDLQDYTYYFVPAPWLSVKLLRLLQHYPPPEDPGVRGRLNECLDTILNKAQEPPKSKKVVRKISLWIGLCFSLILVQGLNTFKLGIILIGFWVSFLAM